MRTKIFITLLTMVLIGGCGRLGVLLMPDPRPFVAAQYKIPKGKKVAILIDDDLSPLPAATMKSELAKQIYDILIKNKAIKDYQKVDYEKVRRACTKVTQGKKVSIRQVGQQVKADYIIYVNVIEFNLQSDPENPLIKPRARAYVKIIEVSSGNRVWPVDFVGREVIATDRMSADLASSSKRSEYADKLLATLAENIAQLFFDHREGKEI